MYGPSMSSDSLQGAIVTVYNAGQAVGGMTVGVLADQYSRRWTIFLLTTLTIVGAVLQCAVVHVGMMIAGRLLAGIGCGQLLSVVPIYIAEVAPPKRRGFLGGLQGTMIAIGLGLANGVGCAGAFASGNAQWRIPLAMQVPVPTLLSIMLFFVPYTPRWLVPKDRHEDAPNVLLHLHATDDVELADRELYEIRAHINMEKEQGDTAWLHAIRQMLSKKNAWRRLLASFIVIMGQLSGSSVIHNF